MITRTRTESRDSDMTGPASLPSHRPQTIAVFGLGPTGQAFCRAALDAGYSVRALVQPNESNVFTDEQPGLRLIEGELTSSSSVRRVIRRADYVVCLVGETLPKKAAYPSNVLTDFVHMLYPLMKQEDWIKAFLFQSTSLSMDVHGRTPILSRVVKAASLRNKRFLIDQDNVIRTLAREHQVQAAAKTASGSTAPIPSMQTMNSRSSEEDRPHFSFVVTRPTVLVTDGPATKKLSASKSQPGPFPFSHADLAEFTLNALLNVKLYDTCPYVVADGF